MATGLIGTNFSPIIPHFFAIITEKTLCNDKLQIPKKIVRKCGNTITEQVLLKLSHGLEWKMGLTKSSDGKLWIEKGWPEFTKHYAIARGHLLVFRYQGNSQFQVVIFDKSTIEIDYCSISKQVKEEPKDKNVDTISRPCPSKKEKSRSPSSRPSKRLRASLVNCKGKLNLLDEQSEIEKTAYRLSAKEKAKALKRARGFKSNRPFFMVPMQPSHVQNKCSLNVPRQFARSHLGTGHKHITLKRALGGGNWSVRYNFKGFDCRNSKPKFEGGWKAFARDNGLKRGDLCVFAMTKGTGSIVFEVSVYKENGTTSLASLPDSGSKVEPIRSLKPLSVGGKARAVETACSVQSENPFFTVVLNSSHASKCQFKLPAIFAKICISTEKKNASLRISDGRSWCVLYKVMPMADGSSVAEFCSGWSAFVRGNKLEEGDICTFALTNKDDFVFQVYIVKAAHENLSPEVGLKETKPSGLKRNVSTGRIKMFPLIKPILKEEPEEVRGEPDELVVEPDGKFEVRKSNTGRGVNRITKASETAKKFCAKHPYFQVNFQSSPLKKTSLYVPISFGRSYLEPKTQNVTLQVGKRSWPVKLLCLYSKVYKLSRGWSAFATDNSLRPRDVCIFELIKRNQAVFEVTIFSDQI